MTEGAGDTLPALRVEIDAIDAGIARLLAERFAVVERVVAVKTREGLPANIPERVEEVVAGARAEARRLGFPEDLAEAVWRAMIAWTIGHEEGRLGR